MYLKTVLWREAEQVNVLAELWVTVRDLISNKPMDLHMSTHRALREVPLGQL